jgi:hypothetical protein
MLYATDGIHSDDDFNKAMVGVASVWRVVFSIICSRVEADYFSGTRVTRESFSLGLSSCD